MRCSLHDILLAHVFFSFIFKYLFNWRLGSVIIFLLPIRFFTNFKKDMSYFGFFYLSFFVRFRFFKKIFYFLIKINK